MFDWGKLRIGLSLGAVLLLAGCGGGRDEGASVDGEVGDPQVGMASSFEDVTVEGLRAMMEEGDPFLVNVHIPFEGDLPDTDASIRFDEIAQNLDLLPANREATIVLYCRSGRMSAEAGAVLAALGYTHVSNLVGGFRAWEAAGYEIVRTPGPR